MIRFATKIEHCGEEHDTLHCPHCGHLLRDEDAGECRAYLRRNLERAQQTHADADDADKFPKEKTVQQWQRRVDFVDGMLQENAKLKAECERLLAIVEEGELDA